MRSVGAAPAVMTGTRTESAMVPHTLKCDMSDGSTFPTPHLVCSSHGFGEKKSVTNGESTVEDFPSPFIDVSNWIVTGLECLDEFVESWELSDIGPRRDRSFSDSGVGLGNEWIGPIIGIEIYFLDG